MYLNIKTLIKGNALNMTTSIKGNLLEYDNFN